MRAVIALAIVSVAAPARAQDATGDTLSYRVHKSDTLELVAAEFYGDRADAVFIVAENKLQHPRPLVPGERLKIPVTREIATAKGEDFPALASTYLGDARRAPYLAEFNSLSPEDSLPTGTTLTIPFHVTHVAAGPESLASIAASYFGDPKQAEMLRRYNNLDKPALDKGESIIVPVLHVRVRPQKLPPLDPDAKARRDQQLKAAADAAIALPVARTAWLGGDFAGVRSALAPLGDRLDYLDAAQAVEIGVLLGKAAVAFDDTAGAVAQFTQVLNRKPRHALSPYADSPKVLVAWKKAGGHVEGE